MVFPEDARLTPEARDLIYSLLCDSEHRLGSHGAGAEQIKVWRHNITNIVSSPFVFIFIILLTKQDTYRLILGSKMLNGKIYTRWMQLSSQLSMENLIPRIL